MTVIKPNSVAGINSITVQSGEALSVHKSDGSLIKTIVSASGVSTFTSASVGAATTDNNRDASINIGLGASISQHTVNSLSLGTGGDERFRIDANGDINLGNNPTNQFGYKLNIQDSAIIYAQTASSGGLEAKWHLDNSAELMEFGTVSTDDLALVTTNIPRVRIDSGGDVGIGTDTMNAPLTVVQNDNAGHIASFRQKNAGNSAQILIDSPTDNNIRPVSIDLAQAGTIKWSLGQAYAAQSDRAFHIATSALSANDTNAKLTITTAGLVGIGTAVPSNALDVQGGTTNTAIVARSTDAKAQISLVDNSTTSVGSVAIGAEGDALFLTSGSGGAEALRIDSSGRVLIGTNTARAVGGESNPRLHIEGSGATSNSWMNITRFSANNGSANIQFAKSRSDTPGTYTVVQDDDNLGQISFLGADGTDMANYAAIIKAQVDGTPGSDDMPGRLLFMTTADGGTFPTEALRITSGGVVQIGGATADSSDIDASNTKLTIKQSGGSQEDGIYIERTGERRGFYIYVGGALSQNDALGIVSQQLGGDTAVLSIDRGGDIVVGAGNIKMNTAGKGIDFSAQTPSSATGATTGDEVLDHYEEGTWTPVPTLTYNPNGRSITLGGNNAGVYTKVGRIVHLEFVAHWTAISGSGSYNVGVNGLPFAAEATTINNGGSGRSNQTGYLFGLESIQNSQVNVLRRYDNGSPNENDIIHCFAVYTASS